MASVLLSTLLLSGCGSQTVSTPADTTISLDSKLRSLSTDLEWTYQSHVVATEKDTSIVHVKSADNRSRIYLYVIEDTHFLVKKELLIELNAEQNIRDIVIVDDSTISFLLRENGNEQRVNYDYKSNTILFAVEEVLIEPVFKGEFAKIQEIFYNAQNNLIDDATFIIVGDSTRAVSSNNAQLLFETVHNGLKPYNFVKNTNSFLQARGSHQLAQFNEETVTMIKPTYSDIIALIPNDGANSIVDMSLGVNDFYHWHDENDFNSPIVTAVIEAKLKTAIDHILIAKPQTNIYLTMPNPQRGWEQATKTYRDAYINVAREYDLPLIDFVADIMPAFSDRVAFEGWYRDGIHFTDEAMIKTANHILSKITPE